ncbi:MAG: hypothetical protein HYU05_00580, partial [Candidatus Wildermuthbacteria bacterium]|nr:hypothetical protein [Candidatus Wildermuthbacteria bacterium]
MSMWWTSLPKAEWAARAALLLEESREAAREAGLSPIFFPGDKRLFLVPRTLWQAGCQRATEVSILRCQGGEEIVVSPCGLAEVSFGGLAEHITQCSDCAKKLGTNPPPTPPAPVPAPTPAPVPAPAGPAHGGKIPWTLPGGGVILLTIVRVGAQVNDQLP